MPQASTFWPTPLRHGLQDRLFTGRQMPRSFLGFVWRLSAWDQVWLTLLSISVSLLGTIPIEVQRRIVNETIKQKDLATIGKLALIYLGLVLAQGFTKLLMNMYRGWISANSVRLLRVSISDEGSAHHSRAKADLAVAQGVEISMIVAEADAVGGYVGECISEPVLEAGILVSVFGYMFVLHPLMAVVSLVTFLPQVVFVPIVQRAINRRVRKRIAMLREAGADVISEEEENHLLHLDHDARFREVFRVDMGVYTLKYTLNFLMNLSGHGGRVAILGLGAFLVVKGQTEVGTVVAFLSGLASINDPWGELVNWFQAILVTNTKYNLVREATAKLAEPVFDGPQADLVEQPS
jgi:ABC-type multidrug transport system fused ATPase/permease subunit